MRATDLDIKYDGTSFWVHFSKGTAHPFASEDIPQAYFLNRVVSEHVQPHTLRKNN